MTDILTIHNFKCFRNQDVELRNLTVLVGANGMGKSSVVQSLLLLRQCRDNNNDSIQLNGPYALALGTYESVRSHYADGEPISIKVQDDGGQTILCSQMIGLDERQTYTMQRGRHDILSDAGIADDKFYFLSAERTGPKISQAIKELTFPHTGCFGEHVAQFLCGHRFKVEDTFRFHPQMESPFLIDQVNAWLNEILPGNRVTAVENWQLQRAQVRLCNTISDDYVEATNLGFGISYCLPIILDGLLAANGCYFIIENPEAHLHPAAQTAMGKFLALVAHSGVHVVVETHSDHILEGIQIYVAQHKDFRESVIINNFSANNEKRIVVTPITYNENIEYAQWPDGFMDASARNYSEYIRLR